MNRRAGLRSARHSLASAPLGVNATTPTASRDATDHSVARCQHLAACFGCAETGTVGGGSTCGARGSRAFWRFWSQARGRRPAPARTSATRRTDTTFWSRASSPWTATSSPRTCVNRLQTLKNLPWYAEWEKGNEPPTLALAWGRWFGADNKGLAHLDEYERERAHMKALARLDGDEGLSSHLRRRPGAGADRRGDRALQAIAVCLPALAD